MRWPNQTGGRWQPLLWCTCGVLMGSQEAPGLLEAYFVKCCTKMISETNPCLVCTQQKLEYTFLLALVHLSSYSHCFQCYSHCYSSCFQASLCNVSLCAHAQYFLVMQTTAWPRFCLPWEMRSLKIQCLGIFALCTKTQVGHLDRIREHTLLKTTKGYIPSW